jgi:uncharacterized protein (DUF1330 family)
MSVYLVEAIEIHDPDGYRKFSEFSRRALQEFVEAGYEFEVLSADHDPKIYEGARPANHLGVFKFNSREDIEAFMALETYQSGLPFRLASSTTRFIMAMDPP